MTKPTLPDYHLKTEFRIGKPSGRLRSFRIQYKEPDGEWTQLHLPEIDLANRLLKDGVTSPEHTLEKFKLILKAQYTHRDRKKRKAPFMAKNLELVEAMYAEVYKRKAKRMKRPEDSKYQLLKAAEACGFHPIDTTPAETLADYLDDTLGHNPQRHARRVTWLNSILQWLGRDKLQTIDVDRQRVRYLNEDEFLEILPHLKRETDRTLARIAFYTGMRIGEIFGLEKRNVRATSNMLFLEQQMLNKKKKHKLDSLKNGESREAFFPDKAKQDILDWCKVPMKDRMLMRDQSFCKRIRTAARKAHGSDDPIKLVNFHDLRHSHANWLLSSGASMSMVAQQLGNGIAVCERYYAGKEIKKETIEMLKRLTN